MEWGRVAETELMPRLVVGYAELLVSKLKKGNGFSKPNSEPGTNNWVAESIVDLSGLPAQDS
jgi:hypothetical protein